MLESMWDGLKEKKSGVPYYSDHLSAVIQGKRRNIERGCVHDEE